MVSSNRRAQNHAGVATEALEPRRLFSTSSDLLAEPDTTAPQVVSIRLLDQPRSSYGIRITFSEPLSQQRAENRENYLILGKLVTKTEFVTDPFDPSISKVDVSVEQAGVIIDRAIYDPDRFSVTLLSELPFKATRSFRYLRINSGDIGLTDVTGNRLDGDRDGAPGGPAIHRFRVRIAKTVRYLDLDRDRVALRLAHGGRVAVLQERTSRAGAKRGMAIQVWLVENVRSTSILTGSVRQNAIEGDGRAIVRELVSAKGAELPILVDPDFTFEVLPDDLNT